MGHDAAAGGKLWGKADKTKILVQKQTGIHRKPAQCICNIGQRHGHHAFCFATTHLRIYHVVIKIVKTQQLRC